MVLSDKATFERDTSELWREELSRQEAASTQEKVLERSRAGCIL